MAKASNKETGRRIDKLQELTLKSRSNTACVEFARQTWGVSRSQAYKLLKRAWEQSYNDIEQVDVSHQELVAWAISQLQEATGIAREQRNIGAVVGCIRAIDPLGLEGPFNHRIAIDLAMAPAVEAGCASSPTQALRRQRQKGSGRYTTLE